MEYLFEIGDEVCYDGVAGIVLDIVGEYMPYQVELQDGSGIVWLREEDLAERSRRFKKRSRFFKRILQTVPKN